MVAGKQSILFDNKIYVEETACVVGQKESEGPLGRLFDEIVQDPMAGMNTWEEAESRLQQMAVDKLLSKWGRQKEEIRYIFAGDLLGQLIATSFALSKYDIPLFGLYGACSTFGEALSLGAMCVDGGYAENVIAMASSHFASAEKQFRFPLEYGNQRPPASTWTVTGCGSVILGRKKADVVVKGITTGKVVDFGVKDSMNMGACMAPAAADVIARNFKDFDVDETYYDMVITGDLGIVGKKILLDLLREKGYEIGSRYTDCGIEIFNSALQDTKAGGSGCGCSAVTMCSWIMKNIRNHRWKRVLFIPTGALLSTVSYNEGKSIPGIAHAVVLERDS
jgi:stage V sporulation protein AD